MKNIGLDFDNTLVLYDQIFYDYALEKNLIPNNIGKSKKSVRDFLLKNNQEEIFTEMQGVIYGELIYDAPVQKDLRENLYKLINHGYKISIISHKTKYPIKGKKIDLHKSALDWLINNKFLDKDIVGIEEKNIFFEDTLEKKIKKINELKCDIFIDDLHKVLNLLNPSIHKILFCNKESLLENLVDIKIINDWNEIYKEILNI